uniref:Carbohydrate kinase PfkB domain-containing protein n=1 Tax=Aegilops tauschii TaxID=37682 RepID=N1QWC9_AEGTA
MAPLGDTVAPLAAAAAPGLVVSFGEMLIDFVPDVAGVSLAESGCFVKAPGGAPANVACAVSKLGGSSAFVGKFGDDEFGHMLVDILKQNGVNAEGCLFDQHARTALAFVTLKSNGEREFMFYRNPSADMLLTEAELNQAARRHRRREGVQIRSSLWEDGLAQEDDAVGRRWQRDLARYMQQYDSEDGFVAGGCGGLIPSRRPG